MDDHFYKASHLHRFIGIILMHCRITTLISLDLLFPRRLNLTTSGHYPLHWFFTTTGFVLTILFLCTTILQMPPLLVKLIQPLTHLLND